jgi:hypothetical protein
MNMKYIIKKIKRQARDCKIHKWLVSRMYKEQLENNTLKIMRGTVLSRKSKNLNRHFIKGDIRVSNHVWRWQHYLLLAKYKFKTMRYYLIYTTIAIIKKIDNKNFGDVEKWEQSNTVRANVKGHNLFGKHFDRALKS